MSEDCPTAPEQQGVPYKTGLALLIAAGIREDRVPAAFDGVQLLADLKELRRTHDLWRAAETPIVGAADVDRASAVEEGAGDLAAVLEAALQHPNTARLLVAALPPAGGDWARILNASAGSRLRLLLSEAQGLQKAARALRNAGCIAAPFPGSPEAHGHLIASKLRELFTRHLGKRRGISVASAKGGPTVSVRFNTEAMRHMGLHPPSPDSVKKAGQRYRRSQRKGDIGS